MRHRTLMGILLLCGGFVWAEEGGKGSKVDLDGTESATPASWVKQAPTNKMRFAQFKLPRAEGDKDDGELVIFKGLGGSANANIDRWKKQFVAPEGKTIDDISKVKTIKMAGGEGKYLEVEGTYLFNPAPFNPASKPTPRAGYQMVAIHFEGPKDVYHIRITGPEKTIQLHKKGIEDWLKGYQK